MKGYCVWIVCKLASKRQPFCRLFLVMFLDLRPVSIATGGDVCGWGEGVTPAHRRLIKGFHTNMLKNKYF